MKNIRVFVFLFISVLLSACNVADQTDVQSRKSASDIKSETFTYNQSTLSLTANTSTVNIIPSSSLTKHRFESFPPMPNGLSLNFATGEISGTATTIQGDTQYLIQATSSLETEYAFINIEVKEEPPKIINYSFSSLNFNKDTPGTFSITTSGGTPDSFSVNTALPAGLVLDSSNGDIGGTPTTSGSSFYTVTATNTSGSATVQVLVNVRDAIPAGLSYSNNSQTLNVGDTSFVTMVPSLTSNPDSVSYSISPSVPPGMVFNTGNGQISGTPTGANGITNYIVTASNDSGSTSTSVTITVNNPARGLSYAVTSFQVQQNVRINPIPIQSYDGGRPVSFSCILCPTGITVDAATGTISGISAVATQQIVTTIRATHAATGTNTDAIMTFNIVEDYPETSTTLGYQGTYTFYNNIAIAAGEVQPSPIQGTPSSYSISSPAALTAVGLAFNTVTGQITGTPIATMSETSFTITGFNNDHTSAPNITSTQTIKLKIEELTPSVLGYENTSSLFYNSTTRVFELQDGNNAALNIVPNIPVGKGRPTTYTVNPPLPDGLTLNGLTGAITGVPREILPVRYYTISGTNSAGTHRETIAISTNTLIAPQSLTYNAGTDALTFSIFNINTYAPTYVGSQGSYTVTPALPDGIILNSSTGDIYGTPIVSNDNVATNYEITVSNSLGTLRKTITIAISNIAPSGLAYTDKNSSTNIAFVEGDTVEKTDILHTSDYANRTGGYITSYTEGGGNNYFTGTIDSGLALNTTTGDITGTAKPTEPYDLNPAFLAATVNGINGVGASAAAFNIKITEKPAQISYASKTNVVTVQGSNVNQGATYLEIPFLVDATNDGGAVARQDTALNPGVFCTATQTNSVEGETYNIAQLEGATVDGDPSTDHVPMTTPLVGGAVPAGNFEFDGSTCSFRFIKNRCFSDDTNGNGKKGDTKTYTITARNSGNTTGETTTLTVHMYDGPNFLFSPDFRIPMTYPLTGHFSSEKHLTLNGTDVNSEYAPLTSDGGVPFDLCHDGQFTLSNLSDLPTPFTFSATDGKIANNAITMLARRSFTLSSTESNSGLNITKSENITVQSNHIENNAGNANFQLDITKFDLNMDGKQDVILRSKINDAAPTTFPNTATTSVYIQNSSTVGLLDGTNAALPVLTGLGALSITPVTYDAAKAGILYTTYGGANYQVRTQSTTNAAESSTTALATAGTPAGVVPMEAATVVDFGVIVAEADNSVSIDQFTINGASMSTVITNASNATRAINEGNNGGISLRGGVQLVVSQDTDSDGNMDAVIAYRGDEDEADNTPDNTVTDTYICVLNSDGTDFGQSCTPRLKVPNSGTVTEIRFANITGDSREEMLVLSNDGTSNTIYVYENRTATFAGLFQQVDTISLQSDSNLVHFDVKDMNNDGRVDIVTNDIEDNIDTDTTTDNIVTGFSIYYHTNNTSNLFNPAINSVFNKNLHYSQSAGNSNQIEVLENGSTKLLMHCQVDTDNGAASITSDGVSLLTAEQVTSCGVVGAF